MGLSPFRHIISFKKINHNSDRNKKGDTIKNKPNSMVMCFVWRNHCSERLKAMHRVWVSAQNNGRYCTWIWCFCFGTMTSASNPYGVDFSNVKDRQVKFTLLFPLHVWLSSPLLSYSFIVAALCPFSSIPASFPFLRCSPHPHHFHSYVLPLFQSATPQLVSSKGWIHY